jgi:hypothetical protein
MKPGASQQLPLTLRGLTFQALAPKSMDLCLNAGQSTALLLPDEPLRLLEALLLGSAVEAGCEVRFWGVDPAAEEGRLSGRVARTFSPLFGGGCWLENLDVDENILLAPLMRGERTGAARERALGLARRLGLEDLPDTRRAQTAPGTLTVCQWVRAFMDERTRLFLMIDSLRKAPGAAIQSLARECRVRRQQGAAFFWVLPLEAACHAETLEIDTILEPLKNLKPAGTT